MNTQVKKKTDFFLLLETTLKTENNLESNKPCRIRKAVVRRCTNIYNSQYANTTLYPNILSNIGLHGKSPFYVSLCGVLWWRRGFVRRPLVCPVRFALAATGEHGSAVVKEVLRCFFLAWEIACSFLLRKLCVRKLGSLEFCTPPLSPACGCRSPCRSVYVHLFEWFSVCRYLVLRFLFFCVLCFSLVSCVWLSVMWLLDLCVCWFSPPLLASPSCWS